MPDVGYPGNFVLGIVQGFGRSRGKAGQWPAPGVESDAGVVLPIRAGEPGPVETHDSVNDAPTLVFRPNAVARTGAEIDVNTIFTSGNQIAPTITGLSSGGFVVTWSSLGDGSNFGVRAQVFNASGARVGDELQVNTVTDAGQMFSDVTALANGRFVVTWQDNSDTPQGGWRIKARIFNDDGTPASAEFQVMPNGENGLNPTIAALASGGFVVTYEANDAIQGQIFDANGNGVGGEFTLNTVADDSQLRPVIAGLSSGGFVAAWADAGHPDDLFNFGITAQIFDASGNKVGDDFVVNSVTSGVQEFPAIAGLSNGGFVVAWRDSTGSSTIEARIYDAAGTPVGSEFLVHSPASAVRSDPSVAALPGGLFVVTWTEEPPSGANPADRNVKGQLFAADGTKLGGEFFVNSGLPNEQYDADVASLTGGGFAAAWIDDGNPGADQDGTAIRAGVFGGPGYFATAQLPYDLKGVIAIDDEDSGSGNLTLTLSVGSGVLTVEAGSSGALVGGSGTGTVTVNGTLAQLQALLGAGGDGTVSFTSAAGGPATVDLAVTVNDNGNSGTDPGLSGGPADEQASGSITIVIEPNDPGIARPDTFTIFENGDALGNVFDANGAGQDQDLDGPPLSVTAVNGSPAAVGNQIVLPSGALLTLGADGQMVYDANGAFDSTPSESSGASNSIAFDTFTYTLAGGGTTTVTIRIRGLDSNDILLDTPGHDSLRGGQGNDRYRITNSDDEVIEGTGSGDDVIQTSASYVLNNSSIETLSTMNSSGTEAINLTGNGFGQSIFGNDGNNILDGAGGNDQLVGFGGNDILIGGAGADVLRGGTGNDVYRIEDSLDIIFELAGEGDDTVAAAASYQLSDGASVETMTTTSQSGTAPINLIGNEVAQSIFGNAGNNLLNGGGGDDQLVGYEGNDILEGAAGFDVMRGNTGNDVYRVEDTLDQIFEFAGEGDDSIAASTSYTLGAGLSIETMTAYNQATVNAFNLIGNEIGQSISGNDGANVLNGMGGIDLLRGYGGADIFSFTTAPNGATNWDVIADFVSGTDKIALDNAVFAGLAEGNVGAEAFVVGTAALDGNDRLIYDSATGRLFFDADGNGAGAAVLFATLSGNPALVASDFMVI